MGLTHPATLGALAGDRQRWIESDRSPLRHCIGNLHALGAATRRLRARVSRHGHRSLVWPRYTIHMKRTNLVLDGDRLEEARRLLGTKTYSETVNKALDEAIRYVKIRSIPQFFGKIKWEGD